MCVFVRHIPIYTLLCPLKLDEFEHFAENQPSPTETAVTMLEYEMD